MNSNTKEKVYCKDCKYYNNEISWDYINIRFHPDEYCSHKNGHHTIDTYLKRKFEYIPPSIKNRNNDCKDYETK